MFIAQRIARVTKRLAPIAGLFLALAAAPACASFHLFTIDELYSNADGSVQFMEMTALAGGQQFFTGHVLTARQGSTSHTFSVPANLPGDTSGHRMIFATQGFADLGILTPDYIVPNGFFFTGSGTVNWAGADEWTYSNLPSDGRLSLNRDGSTSVNSPQNFAGQTATVQLAALNYEGLWWNSPAGSESGWGVNIAHQGDILFATWFTYDSDGSGLWLVMPDGVKTGSATYSGTLYRTTGPSFDSASFDPSKVVATQVGSATFTFSDVNNGTFSYTVNGVSQAKAITRQVYATPVPTCTAGGTPPAVPNYQDLWWHSPAGSESGWGVNITHQGAILFATWFTYDASGKGLWLVMSNGAQAGPASYSGTLYRTTGPAFSASPWNGSQVTATAVGTATFTFTDANNGMFAYTVNGVSQSKPITRQVFSTPTTVCVTPSPF
ncbi:MAG TPA: hypothetical protein VEG27_02545 [Usitatibacter sp.]|nr:hypothetical protein [Usitatibacter sp.]